LTRIDSANKCCFFNVVY